MTILLDSTFLISTLRGDAKSTLMLQQMLRSGDSLATSVINIGEVYSGLRAGELKRVEQFLAELEVHPVSYAIAKRAGELRNAAAGKGRTLELDDMLIAATALSLDSPLITDNRKDFKGTGVTFYPTGEN
jgi:tRNA(fMet)-specific endonuclease VapC